MYLYHVVYMHVQYVYHVVYMHVQYVYPCVHTYIMVHLYMYDGVLPSADNAGLL